MATAGNQRVMVAVRIRPRLSDGAQMQMQEKFELQSAYRTGDTTLRVELTPEHEPVKMSTFTFDYIFDQESTQLEVYEDAVVDMVDAALVGHNGTLLAYGQTGSGKTFTVLGDVKPNPLENDLLTTDSGMFLRVLSDLLEYKQRQAKKGWHVVIGLSCVEIYNENVRDLFGGAPDQPPPPLKAVMIGDTVLLPSLKIKEMTTIHAVFSEIQLAIARRKSRATDTNSSSSRSHCLFTIDILQQAATAPPPSLDLLDARNNSGSSSSGEGGGGAAGGGGSGKPSVVTKRVVVTTGATTSSGATTPAAGGGGRSAGGRSGSTTNMAAAVAATAAAEQAVTLAPHEMPFHGTVLLKSDQKEPIYASKIILADLAGSERITRSGVTGQGLTEATSINSSLTALGNVVHSLFEGSFASYRTSNLTALLKPTFSHPSSRVLLLAQCSPTQLTFDETISTLHFANKVKAMKVSTTTAAQADQLLFEYLKAEKLHDSVAADLHIFAAESCAQPAVIRRSVAQHHGLYYDEAASSITASLVAAAQGGGGGSVSNNNNVNTTAAGGAADKQQRGGGVSMRERKARLDALGATAAAQREREALLAQQAKEKSEEAAKERHEVDEKRDELVREHTSRRSELLESVQGENALRLRHAMQSVLVESAAQSNRLVGEEAAAWQQLRSLYAKEHKSACANELRRLSALYETMTKELVKLEQAARANASATSPERDAEAERYALSAWLHCVAQRTFAKMFDLREVQLALLAYQHGNARLEHWMQRHQSMLQRQQQQQSGNNDGNNGKVAAAAVATS